MSTRSFIAKQIGENKFRTIYCHSDGYLTYNGAMLLDHYNTPEKLDALLNLGDISYLAPKIDPDPDSPHSFDNGKRQEGVVLAYGRDRGEKGTEAKEYTLEQLTDEDNWTEYVYFLDSNNCWKYCTSGNMTINDVKEDLNKEYESFGIERPKGYYGFLDKQIAEEFKNLQKENQSSVNPQLSFM